MRVEPNVNDDPHSGPKAKPQQKNPNGNQSRVALAMPKIVEIHKEEWDKHDPPFTKFDALQVKHSGEGGYDFFVNVDNTFLLTEISRAKEIDRPLIKYWFTYGLVLAGYGMLRHSQRLDKEDRAGDIKTDMDDVNDDADTETVSRYCDGLAQVIIPIIRNLYRGPVD